jgi:metal transporter CNNM
MCAICLSAYVLVLYVYFFPRLVPVLFIHLKLSTAPIAYPVAKLLDYVLGAESTHTYKKAELKSFLQFHRTGEVG